MTLNHLRPVESRDAGRRATIGVSRRAFLKAGVAAAGFVARLGLPGFLGNAGALRKAASRHNAFIGSAARVVTMTIEAVEMGQGNLTSYPMLIAESSSRSESVRVGARPARRTSATGIRRLFGDQITGGYLDTGVWEPLFEGPRPAHHGVMLIGAAAKRWRVESRSARGAGGEVVQQATEQDQIRGAAADAAQMPVPEKAREAPGRVQDDRHAGQAPDTPLKVNGKAIYGTIPTDGLKIARRQSPTLAGG